MASKCMSQRAESRLPSTSLSSLNLGLQVHHQTHLSMASKHISEFTLSQFPNAYLNLLDTGLQVNL